MTHTLTDENFVKLKKILSIKKRVSNYRMVIISLLFLVVVPTCFSKYYEHTPANIRGFIILSAFGLILIVREYFGPFSSVRRVFKTFITVFNNEGGLLVITTADGAGHSFPKRNTSFHIAAGAPFYWGDLYGNLFSPAFFDYDWSVPEKSIYRIKLNNEKYVIQPSLFKSYEDIALEIINVSDACKPATQ